MEANPGGKKKKNLVIGVDVGGTKIIAATVDTSGKILGSKKRKTKAHKGVTSVIDRIIKTIRQAAEDADTSLDKIAAVSLGFPGPLDAEKGVIYTAPNLAGWDNFPLAKTLEKELGLPVILDNDVNLGTLGEYEFGAAAGAKSVIGIFVGTGIGGGIILDGKLLSGRNGTAGELGHMSIDYDGPKAASGIKGAYEALASRTAIVRDIEKAVKDGKECILADNFKGDEDDKRVTSGDLKKAIQSKDKVVTEILDRACFYLGVGVGSLVNVFGPDVVVMGGGVVEALEDYMMTMIKKSAADYTLANALKGVKIVPAKLGDDAVLMGCVASAWRHFKIGQD